MALWAGNKQSTEAANDPKRRVAAGWSDARVALFVDRQCKNVCTTLPIAATAMQMGNMGNLQNMRGRAIRRMNPSVPAAYEVDRPHVARPMNAENRSFSLSASLKITVGVLGALFPSSRARPVEGAIVPTNSRGCPS